MFTSLPPAHMTHTPGPWTLGPTIRDENGFVGRNVYGQHNGQDRFVCNVSTHEHKGEEDQGVANARLMAAAPTMLAALKFSLECPDEEEAMRVVQAAIAQAEGSPLAA